VLGLDPLDGHDAGAGASSGRRRNLLRFTREAETACVDVPDGGRGVLNLSVGFACAATTTTSSFASARTSSCRSGPISLREVLHAARNDGTASAFLPGTFDEAGGDERQPEIGAAEDHARGHPHRLP
jgi:hypothetical protein